MGLNAAKIACGLGAIVTVFDINAERMGYIDDIESIQVLKGAAASALYGYRGGNGAILITTKSGKKGKPVNIEFNNNLTFNMIYDYRDFQNVFGQGDYGVRPTSVAGAETTQTSSW